MAGDEKHARELIACARNDLADAERCQRLGMTPSAGTLMRTFRQMIAAFDASLPGDDDWEYRYAEIYDDGTYYTYGPGEGLWFETAEGARADRVEESDVIVRRRKPGPVEILSEPVEEVPRG